MTKIYEDGSFQLFGMDADIYSDLYKSVFGSRPRGEQIFTSFEQLDDEWDNLQQYLEVNQIQDKKCAEHGWKTLVKDIKANITLGAKTKKDSLRWIADANNTHIDEDGIDYLLFLYGINVDVSAYTNKLKEFSR